MPYALSHIYNRHTVILGRGRPWCTIRPTDDPNEANFATSCQVHLLYIGKDIYVPLTPRTEEVPSYIRECEQEIANIFDRQAPLDYAAFYREPEYSDYMEVTTVKSGWPHKSHSHGEPTHTVSKVPDELDQPVFPSLVLLNDNQQNNKTPTVPPILPSPSKDTPSQPIASTNVTTPPVTNH